MKTKFFKTSLLYCSIFIIGLFIVSFSYQYEDFIIEDNNESGFVIVDYKGKQANVKVPAIYRGKKITDIDGYQSRGRGVFQNSDITHVVFSEGIESIGFWSFGSCEKLVEINLPKSLKNIGGYAFVDCRNLEKITIPANVTNIGNYVFYGCSKLSVVVMEATTPPLLENITNNLFLNTSPYLTIEVPSESINDYMNAQGWIQYSRKMISRK